MVVAGVIVAGLEFGSASALGRGLRRLGTRGAICAKAQQQQVVILEFETFWREVGEIAGALLDFKHLAAGAAVEVVMVRFAGDFVARGLTGHFDLHDSAIGDEGFQRAIDGGHAHAAHATLGKIEDLASGNRTMRLGNDRLDRVALLGVAFHSGHAGF